jgi:hypothetical protein
MGKVLQCDFDGRRDSRYLVAVAVVGITLAGTTRILYATVLTARLMAHPFREVLARRRPKAHPRGGRTGRSVPAGITCTFIALGSTNCSSIRSFPSCLAGHRDLDDLKARVLGIVIVVLGPLRRQALTWDGQRDLLPFGASIAVGHCCAHYFSRRSRAGR